MKTNTIFRKVLFLLLVVTLLSESIINDTIKVSAGSSKTATDERAYLFAVPEGGWSTITVHISYTEKQVKSGTKNKWWRRELFYAYKTEYTTEQPYMKLLNNIEHRNEKGKLIHKFEKWTPVDSIADGKWDYFACYRNGKNMYYKPTAKNRASVSYLVFCDGGIPVNGNGHTLRMTLNTK